MSLITDLLPKVKQRKLNRDVPPILKDAVLKSRAERQTRKKLAVILLLILLLIGGGFGVVSLMQNLKERPPVVRAPVPPTPAFEPASQPATPALQAQPQTDAAVAGAKASNVAGTVPMPERKKASPAHSYGKRVKVRKFTEGTAQEKDGSTKVRREKATGEELSGSRVFNRDDKDFALYAALTYETQGKYHQALLQYSAVLAMEPSNYAVMNNISSMLIYLGSYEESTRYAQKALNLRKDYVPSLVNMGIDYSYLGKPAESEDCFRRALTIEPGNRYALLNLALLYEKQNAFDKADKYYARLSQEGDAQSYMGLARI
ncbi:MAG: tetratricopeptide repeat protein, partial [Syntrophales bacterium LBB04]|nr:tetratricopeptide repeat protein [Syntrophales bacterium LBB04]